MKIMEVYIMDKPSYITGPRSVSDAIKGRVVQVLDEFRNRRTIQRMDVDRAAARIANLVHEEMTKQLESVTARLCGFIHKAVKDELK